MKPGTNSHQVNRGAKTKPNFYQGNNHGNYKSGTAIPGVGDYSNTMAA